MFWFVIALVLFGLLVGGLARLLVPGPDPMGVVGTWLLGVTGSFVGGFLGYLLFGAEIGNGPVQAAGLVGSVIGSIIVLLLVRRFGDRRATT